MTHIEGCTVGARTDHPMDLQGANTLLAGQHQVENLKPDQKGIVRVLENRAADDAETIVLARLTEPVKGPRVQLVGSRVAATRAAHATGPAPIHQVALTGALIWEKSVKLGKRHLADEFRFVLVPCCVHEKEISADEPQESSPAYFPNIIQKESPWPCVFRAWPRGLRLVTSRTI